jgi:cobalamin biosynthesis Mg chelatase CobN
MATTSKVADELFALPKQYDSTNPINGPGARRQARQERKNQLTSQMGLTVANTKLAAEAADQANAAAATIETRVQEMVTEKSMLQSTIAELTKSSTSRSASTTNTHIPQSPLAKAVLSGSGSGSGSSSSDSNSSRATALGEAREAEFYIDTSQQVKEWATKWGIVIIVLLGVLGLIYAWYHRFRIVPLLIMFVILGLAAHYPVYTIQIPRAAILPFLKLV